MTSGRSAAKPTPGAAIPSIALVVGILVLISSVSISSTDMYSPSMPDLVRWFDTTAAKVKLTISLNFLAFGLAQLVHGPLSDRFGRKPVLLVSLGTVCLLCLACASAQTINQLIVARVLLGIAAAAEAVVGLAIIKDLYNEKQQVKALALIGMVIAITPAAAPILGGYIHVVWGWQANFFVISVMSLVALSVVALLLPESTTPDTSALRWSVISGRYIKLLQNSDFMIHSALLGVTLGLLFVFVTAAPFVLIDVLGVTPDRFGYYQASIVLAFFLGSILASRLADSWHAFKLMSMGIFLVLVGSITLSIVIYGDNLTPYLLAGSFMIMTFGMGPLFAVAPSRALRSVEGNAGSASALLSGIEQTTAGVAAVFISILHDGSARPMVIVTIFLALLLLALAYCSKLQD